MTLQEIQNLAGHRNVPPWVVKLVGDAIEAERERILEVIGNNQCECRCSEVVRGQT